MSEALDKLGNVPGYDKSKEKISTTENGELYIYHDGQPSIKITQAIANRIAEFQSDYPFSHQDQQISPINAWEKIKQLDLQEELEDRGR